MEVVTGFSLDELVGVRDCSADRTDEEEGVSEVVTGPAVELGGSDVACEVGVGVASGEELREVV